MPGTPKQLRTDFNNEARLSARQLWYAEISRPSATQADILRANALFRMLVLPVQASKFFDMNRWHPVLRAQTRGQTRALPPPPALPALPPPATSSAPSSSGRPAAWVRPPVDMSVIGTIPNVVDLSSYRKSKPQAATP